MTIQLKALHKFDVAACRIMLLTALLVLSGCSSSNSENSTQSLSNTTKEGANENTVGNNGGTKPIAKVRVLYSLAKNQFTQHEPIILTFTVQNGLVEPLVLDLGYERKENFLFTVRRPDGSTIEAPQLRRTFIDGPSDDGVISVEVGQTYTQELLCNEWFDFPTAGRYELDVQLVNPIQTKSGATVSTDTAFQTTVEVKPRDVERLQQVCADFLVQITNGSSYDYNKVHNAARTLSYIKDPIAVPYLEKALSANRLVDRIAVAGLVRIDGEEGTNALISALKTQPRQNVRELIRPALQRISYYSSDAVLKEKIRQVLSKG